MVSRASRGAASMARDICRASARPATRDSARRPSALQRVLAMATATRAMETATGTRATETETAIRATAMETATRATETVNPRSTRRAIRVHRRTGSVCFPIALPPMLPDGYEYPATVPGQFQLPRPNSISRSRGDRWIGSNRAELHARRNGGSPTKVATASSNRTQSHTCKICVIKSDRFVVNSGYRAPGYNLMIGGVNSSRHIYGDGFDLDPVDVPLATLRERMYSQRRFPRGVRVTRALRLAWHPQRRRILWSARHDRTRDHTTAECKGCKVTRSAFWQAPASGFRRRRTHAPLGRARR